MRNLKFGYLKLRNGNSEKKFEDFIKLRVGDSPYIKENKQKKKKTKKQQQPIFK